MKEFFEETAKSTRFSVVYGEVPGHRASKVVVTHDKKTLTTERKLVLSTSASPIAIVGELQKLRQNYALRSMVETVVPEETFDAFPKEPLQLFSDYLAFKRQVKFFNEHAGAFSPVEQEHWSRLTQLNEQEARVYFLSKRNTRPEVKKWFLALPPRAGPTLTRIDTALTKLGLRNDLSRPPSHAKALEIDQLRNDLSHVWPGYFSPRHSTVKLPYRPQEANTFELPYVLLSADEVTHFGREPSPEMKEGDKYRFFIHPQSLHFYKALIESHPLHRGPYVGSPYSSGRSLLVWDPKTPESPLTVKVGLDAQMGHSRRNIPPKEALHATLVSEGLRQIPEEYFKSIGLQPIFEDSALVANGYDSSLIFKDAASERGYQSFFSLLSAGETGYPVLVELAHKAGKSPEAFAREEVLKPLVQALARLYLDYGFMPEPHTQNITVRIVDGRVTGFGFKDFSGVAIDWEIRRRRGLDDSFLKTAEREHPGVFAADYHVKRGETYADRGIGLHLSQGLLAGVISALGEKYGEKQPELANFVAEAIYPVLLMEGSRPRGTSWTEWFRSVVREGACPWRQLASQ